MKFHDFHDFRSRGWTLARPKLSYTNLWEAELLHEPRYMYYLNSDQRMLKSIGWIQSCDQITDENLEIVYSPYRRDLPRAGIVLLEK